MQYNNEVCNVGNGDTWFCALAIDVLLLTDIPSSHRACRCYKKSLVMFQNLRTVESPKDLLANS